MEWINAPVREWTMPRPGAKRRVGVAFVRPLQGRISKCHDKGADGINAPVLGIKAEVNDLEKIRSIFYLL
jgi:hypothetical protein